MGLNCSHEAFDGPYSRFNRIRQLVAWAVGGSFPPHYVRKYPDGQLLLDKDNHSIMDEELDYNMWYWDGEKYCQESHPGLWLFLNHSDCDGEISPEDCVLVAHELEAIASDVSKVGRIVGFGYKGSKSRYDSLSPLGDLPGFIQGCKNAAEVNEPLTFG